MAAGERLIDASRRSSTDQSARGDLHAVLSELCTAASPAAPKLPSVPKAPPARRARRAPSPSPSSSSSEDEAPAPRKRPRARRAAPSSDEEDDDDAPVPCSQADLPQEERDRNQTALWHKLRSEGWTYRPSTSLADNWWYLRPGVKGRIRDLERNVDYFGVEDLWVYADKHDLWPTGVVVAAPPARKKKKKTTTKKAPPPPRAASSSDDDEPPEPRDKKRAREIPESLGDTQDVRAELKAQGWSHIMAPDYIQRARPAVTQVWKRPGVRPSKLVLGYNCFATADLAALHADDRPLSMAFIRAECEKYLPDLLVKLPDLDDDAARYEYAKARFDQENAVHATSKRARRGEK